MTEVAEKQDSSALETIFSSINISVDDNALAKVDYDYVTSEDNSEMILADDFARLGSALSAIFANNDSDEINVYNKDLTRRIIDRIDEIVATQVNSVLRDDKFREVEQQWLSIKDLYENTADVSDIELSLLDVSKDELLDDFETNAVDISSSDLFKKIYVKEYDQYGGEPYGCVVGLYEFDNSEDDINWLSIMGKISQASHSPFISAVSPSFFGCQTMDQIQEIKNIGALMTHHRYSNWNKLRKSEQAAYIGLTLPRYLARAPYDLINNPCGKSLPNFVEEIKDPNKLDEFVWGNSAILMAKNMARAFEKTGWCQSIRGPRAGGTVEDLAGYVYNTRGVEEKKIPVELIIPDYRELDFAESGFIPFVFKKESNEGCFFSSNSIKLKETFEDPRDSENSQLVANMAYTMSISRIAHYVKVLMRDRIGGTDNEVSISEFLNKWVFQYVTTIPDPMPLTRSHHPFKAAEILVNKVDGMAGWYSASIAILPHVQFEGMDVELKVDTRIG